MYADDTQFWVSLGENESINNETTARSRVKQAFSIISSFMEDSHLKLNPAKTQFIPISRNKQASSFSSLELNDHVSVPPSATVRNLGVIMDSKLDFHAHVSDVRKSCFFQLKRLKSIRTFIPESQFATLIHAFITSRLDFCNSFFFALPDNLVSRLQIIQNSCAKCITGTNLYSSATEARIKLHWLPIRHRSKFKISIMAHKTVHHPHLIPSYISQSFTTSKHARTTRFNLANTLVSNFKCRLKTVGGRSITSTLPDVWNSLPSYLRDPSSTSSFKSQLKTHLFREAYTHYM